MEFHIRSGEEFAPLLVLINHEATTTRYLVTAIIDYRQTESMLDGKRGLLHEMTMPPSSEIEFPFSLGPLSPGFHDVQIAVFVDPYRGYGVGDVEAARQSHEGFKNLFVWYTGRRTTVIVDGDRRPFRRLTSDAIGAVPNDDVPVGPAAFLAKASPKHPVRDQLVFDAGIRSTTYYFRTWTSRYKNDGPGVHAIMFFLDYRQIEVNGRDVLLADLDAGEEAILETSIVLPDTPGDHHLFGFVVVDPYQEWRGDELRYAASLERSVIRVH